jgi:catecholate siderophore receptor
VCVVTKDYIRDQSFQTLTDVTRYVPGVAIHQGEGNRDELVIRGVDSSANFFVNERRARISLRKRIGVRPLCAKSGPSRMVID